MLWPNGTNDRPPISSPFGPRDVTQQGASSNHMGTDFIGFAMVRAVAAGRVVSVGWRDGWSGGGYMIWIQHDGFLSRSLHLVNQSAQVSVGDYVAEGQAIGLMGTTASPYPVGRHLHLEIVVNGRQVDPVPFITARLSTGAALAGGASTEGFLMGLNDTQQRQMYEALVVGGQSAGAYYTPEAIINVIRTELAPAIAAIALGGIAFPGAPQWNAFQTIVNVVREDDGREMPVIDPKDFASSVAPLLAPLLNANLGTLSDETIAEIAKAAADEQARRLAS